MQNVNYPGLRRLYDLYNSQGFNLIAFPCNQVSTLRSLDLAYIQVDALTGKTNCIPRMNAGLQFGGQAPGSSEEERRYAQEKFGFKFDVMVMLRLHLSMHERCCTFNSRSCCY